MSKNFILFPGMELFLSATVIFVTSLDCDTERLNQVLNISTSDLINLEDSSDVQLLSQNASRGYALMQSINHLRLVFIKILVLLKTRTMLNIWSEAATITVMLDPNEELLFSSSIQCNLPNFCTLKEKLLPIHIQTSHNWVHS